MGVGSPQTLLTWSVSLESWRRQQPSFPDPLPHLSAGVTGPCLTPYHGARIAGSPVTSTVCQGSASPSERMYLLSDGDNNTYSCVINALDFGARFLISSATY